MNLFVGLLCARLFLGKWCRFRFAPTNASLGLLIGEFILLNIQFVLRRDSVGK